MDNRKIKLGIEEIRNISMTRKEKDMILNHVLNFGSSSPSSVKSSWFSYFSFVQKSRLVYYVAVPLIILLASGGVVFASQDSLPDSILYPVKTKVLEPINEALKITPESKAKYESKLASTRLTEAETLANKGQLDSSKEKQINDLLSVHTNALNKALNEMNQAKETEIADNIAVDFRAEMNAHAKVLDIIATKHEDKLNKKDNQNNDTNTNDSISVSNNARISADKIKENQKGNAEDSNEEKYNNKKQNVESLINQADKNFMNGDDESAEEDDPSLEEDDDTKATLDKAKQYLDEAKTKEQEGNREDAYHSLLDSESSIKEANILFNSKINLNQGNNNNKNNSKFQNLNQEDD